MMESKGREGTVRSDLGKYEGNIVERMIPWEERGQVKG